MRFLVLTLHLFSVDEWIIIFEIEENGGSKKKRWGEGKMGRLVQEVYKHQRTFTKTSMFIYWFVIVSISSSICSGFIICSLTLGRITFLMFPYMSHIFQCFPLIVVAWDIWYIGRNKRFLPPAWQPDANNRYDLWQVPHAKISSVSLPKKSDDILETTLFDAVDTNHFWNHSLMSTFFNGSVDLNRVWRGTDWDDCSEVFFGGRF